MRALHRTTLSLSFCLRAMHLDHVVVVMKSKRNMNKVFFPGHVQPMSLRNTTRETTTDNNNKNKNKNSNNSNESRI